MSSAEEVFSAKQAADRLGLSPAMTRRYGAALEELTGEAIRQHPRDGRQYGREQLEAMRQAKSFVESNPRLSVVQALTLALGQAPEVATPAALLEPGDPSGALVGALAQALERSLLPELRELRAEVAGLREELRRRDAEALQASRTAENRQLAEAPAAAAGVQTEHVTAAATGPGGGGGADEDGPLAQALHRIGRRLERLFLRR